MVSISVKKSLFSLPVAVSESGEGRGFEGGREGGNDGEKEEENKGRKKKKDGDTVGR